MRFLFTYEQMETVISLAEEGLKVSDELDKLKEQKPEDEERIKNLSGQIELYDWLLDHELWGRPG